MDIHYTHEFIALDENITHIETSSTVKPEDSDASYTNSSDLGSNNAHPQPQVLFKF